MTTSAILNSIILLGFFGVFGIAALMSPMLMDAPGSERKAGAWIFIGLLAAIPLASIAFLAAGWGLWLADNAAPLQEYLASSRNFVTMLIGAASVAFLAAAATPRRRLAKFK